MTGSLQRTGNSGPQAERIITALTHVFPHRLCVMVRVVIRRPVIEHSSDPNTKSSPCGARNQVGGQDVCCRGPPYMQHTTWWLKSSLYVVFFRSHWRHMSMVLTLTLGRFRNQHHGDHSKHDQTQHNMVYDRVKPRSIGCPGKSFESCRSDDGGVASSGHVSQKRP